MDREALEALQMIRNASKRSLTPARRLREFMRAVWKSMGLVCFDFPSGALVSAHMMCMLFMGATVFAFALSFPLLGSLFTVAALAIIVLSVSMTVNRAKKGLGVARAYLFSLIHRHLMWRENSASASFHLDETVALERCRDWATSGKKYRGVDVDMSIALYRIFDGESKGHISEWTGQFISNRKGGNWEKDLRGLHVELARDHMGDRMLPWHDESLCAVTPVLEFYLCGYFSNDEDERGRKETVYRAVELEGIDFFRLVEAKGMCDHDGEFSSRRRKLEGLCVEIVEAHERFGTEELKDLPPELVAEMGSK